MRKLILVLSGMLGTFVVLAVIILQLQRSDIGVDILQNVAPIALPSSQLARNLESSDTNLVIDSLSILEDCRDPIAIQKALQLLGSSDDYVWLNAALYLGAVGRVESIPYLIKAFRHTAWRADAETLSDLQHLTGQNFPPNFGKWTNWWEATHTNVTFDFDSHLGPIPRR